MLYSDNTHIWGKPNGENRCPGKVNFSCCGTNLIFSCKGSLDIGILFSPYYQSTLNSILQNHPFGILLTKYEQTCHHNLQTIFGLVVLGFCPSQLSL